LVNNINNGIPYSETERSRLREFVVEDAAEYLNYHNMEESLAFYDWKPDTLADAQKDIEMIISDYDYESHIQWGITNKENNTLIGDCGLLIDAFGLKAEINYMLSRDYWGLGLMTEALNSVISYCFNETNIIRIQALSHPDNHSSSKLLTQLGFSLEGRLNKYGYSLVTNKPVDLNMWSLLKD
jgi:[ribosomal protein S5]-alanine N-acetyltransferase